MRENEKLPEIVRARGYRLYDARGGRYIDFYQNGGRALLGHRPPGAAQAVKATINRGLVAEYPTVWGGRLARLLKTRFQDKTEITVYPSQEKALRAAGAEAADITFEEGRRRCSSGHAVPLWRPGSLSMEEEKQLLRGEMGSCFMPLLPFPGMFGPAVLCQIHGTAAADVQEPVSPMLEAMLVKCTAALQKWEQDADRSKWEYFDVPGVLRRGPYLRFLLDEDNYRELQGRMLSEGVLLPPDTSTPAVIPGEFTQGEVKPLRKELERLYGDS